MALDQAAIQEFLERLGSALSDDQAAEVARCWEAPSLVLSDHGAIPVAERDEVERFFAQAIQAYRTQGMVSTRPEILHVERFGEKIAGVLVRWRAFDASGGEKTSERSYYLLRLGDDGAPRIRVAVTLTPPE